MEFKTWIETETPASDEVIRSGMQPQVGSETLESDPQGQFQNLDSKIKDLDQQLMAAGKNPKISYFRGLWKGLKRKWDEINRQSGQSGLGTEMGDQGQMTQDRPDMVDTRYSLRIPHDS